MLRPKLSFKQASLAHAVTVDKSNQSTISAEKSTISAEQSAIETESTISTVHSTIESEHSAKTTGIIPTVTGRWQSVMVPRVTTVTDELYYPIYGEYYTGQAVTVTRTYATTVEEWQVAFINERRESLLRIEYRVLWVYPDSGCKHLYLRTWEPAARLREDGFADGLDLVDRWKTSDVPLFEDFWRQDQDGMGRLGADEENLCVFNALKRAAELLGRPDLVTEQDIEQFIDDRHGLYNQDLRAGAMWVDVRDFMIRLREAGRDINYNAFVKNNYLTPGRRGARVMREVPLEDGVYIVAAYNHSHIGHAAVLSVPGRKRLFYDKKNEQGKPITSAKGLDQLLCIYSSVHYL
ncbi:hypothetical protein P3T76_000405 [Phytophthora citrophthora]|uniref:Uncharacterized protein n=1 Tax=Phytophthora citrophthora TaxID=4793 RepID=A0AAD9H003_9STRA|nr:hypothetical protein P3T76_000405 [Phytophthora citrophthora]